MSLLLLEGDLLSLVLLFLDVFSSLSSCIARFFFGLGGRFADGLDGVFLLFLLLGILFLGVFDSLIGLLLCLSFLLLGIFGSLLLGVGRSLLVFGGFRVLRSLGALLFLLLLVGLDFSISSLLFLFIGFFLGIGDLLVSRFLGLKLGLLLVRFDLSDGLLGFLGFLLGHLFRLVAGLVHLILLVVLGLDSSSLSIILVLCSFLFSLDSFFLSFLGLYFKRLFFRCLFLGASGFLIGSFFSGFFGGSFSSKLEGGLLLDLFLFLCLNSFSFLRGFHGLCLSFSLCFLAHQACFLLHLGSFLLHCLESSLSFLGHVFGLLLGIVGGLLGISLSLLFSCLGLLL